MFSRRLGSEAIERLPNDYITLNKTSDFPGFETFWKNWVFYKCTTQTDTEYSSSLFGAGNRTFPPNIASLPESYFKVHLVLRHLKENVKDK